MEFEKFNELFKKYHVYPFKHFFKIFKKLNFIVSKQKLQLPAGNVSFEEAEHPSLMMIEVG